MFVFRRCYATSYQNYFYDTNCFVFVHTIMCQKLRTPFYFENVMVPVQALSFGWLDDNTSVA